MNRIELTSERGRGRATVAARTRRVRPSMMVLAGRTLLSTFMVTSTDDSAPADNPTPGTLCCAVQQADANNQAETIVSSSLFIEQPSLVKTIASGNANFGGGLRNDSGTLVLTNVRIQGNHAIVGGGLFNDGRTTLSAVSIEGNRAHVGSGIFNTRAATLLWRRSPAAIRKTARLHREGANSVNRITPEHETDL